MRPRLPALLLALFASACGGSREGGEGPAPRPVLLVLPATLVVPQEPAVGGPRGPVAHVEVAAGRWLIRRPVQVPAGRLIEADVVVRGEARLGRGTRIRGSVKSDKDLHLADGVIVEGSVVSARNVYIGAGCRISGPVLAEGDVRVEPGCHIGRPGHLTTLSARKMWLAPGNVVHGTIWAHEGGVVATMGTPLEAVS